MKASTSRTKVSQLILDEASTWFVEFSQGDVDVSGRAEFNIWLRRSPEHVQAYLQIATLWEDAPLLKKSRVFGPGELIARAIADGNVVPLDAPRAEREYSEPARCGSDGEVVFGREVGERGRNEEKIAETIPARACRSGIYQRPSILAVAATLLIAIFGTASWYQFHRAPTYSTEVGEQRSVRLSDGSTVEINSRSKLRVRFSEHERLVELLDGQAIFKVAKEHKRPFIVSSGETRVRAVGTQFDVYRRSSGTVVTVLEGRVAVGSPLIDTRQPPVPGSGGADSPSLGNRAVQGQHGGPPSAPESPSSRSREGGQSAGSVAGDGGPLESQPRLSLSSSEVLLAAGQRLTATPIALTAPEPANISAATAWTRREIVFQSSPLSEVIEEFNRYNPRRMVIVDPSLRDTRVSGVFSSTDPNSLLRFLRGLPNFNVLEAEDEIRISSR